METIYALSTPPGRGGVAVVRVSGPQAAPGLVALTAGARLPLPRTACVRRIVNLAGAVIDHALVLRFEGPNSFTGEDVVEYHLHGGVAVVSGLLSSLAALPGCRPALPGEFTRRAFENGRLDLTAAEAIADLIHAETEAQRDQAIGQMEGVLSDLYQSWTDRLAQTLALMEADLDFSDQDLPDDLLLRVRPDLSDVEKAIAAHLDDNHRGERLRDGFRIAILGAPNAGKSTLLNALARRDVAIVSDIAGTTRDVLDIHLNIAGFPAVIADTAGLRDSRDAIEREGMKRARARAADADIVLLLFDGTAPADAETLSLIDDRSIPVITRADQQVVIEGLDDYHPVRISAPNGQGLPDLMDKIAARLSTLAGPRQTPALTRARHRQALEAAHTALLRSRDASLPELAAEDLRLSIRHLGSITGRVDVEDILDMIFRDFCIGK